MFVSQTCDRKMTIIPFDPTSISSINGTKQAGMKRNNDGQPDVRGGDLRTSVPVVFSPYKLCFSLFANINDCHGQLWHSQHRARSIWVRERSYTTSQRGTNILHYLVGRIKPEHFMMQNICMATETTSSFYQNEPNKMQHNSLGKAAAAQIHL